MKKQDSLVGESYLDLIQRRFVMQATIGILALVILILTYMISQKEVVYIVTPMNLQSEFKVEEGQSNKGYANIFGYSIAAIMGNVNKVNVDFVTKRIVEMMSPFLRAQMGEALRREAQILKVKDATQTFTIEDQMYSEEHQVVFVWGLRTIKSSRGKENTERWTYEFRIIPYGGVPRITHFDSYSGAPKLKQRGYVVDVKPYLTEELENVKNSTVPEDTQYKKAQESN